MQQVGGSIGTAALSTIALTATTSYLALHHAGPLAVPTAATHGYTIAFIVSGALFALGLILALVLLPSRQRLAELRASSQSEATAGAATGTTAGGTVLPATSGAAAGPDGARGPQAPGQ
jgi:hypothetical protein